MSTTTSLSMALLIILCIDGIFLLGNTAMLEINPDSTTNFFNYDNSSLSSFSNGAYVLNTDYVNDLPAGAETVSPETDNVFTDTFKSIKEYFSNSVTGKGVIYGFRILGAPVSFLTIINAPQVITFTIGVIWYGITFFLLVMVMFGRS